MRMVTVSCSTACPVPWQSGQGSSMTLPLAVWAGGDLADRHAAAAGLAGPLAGPGTGQAPAGSRPGAGPATRGTGKGRSAPPGRVPSVVSLQESGAGSRLRSWRRHDPPEGAP